MYTMKESVAVAKEADAKKGVSPTKTDNSILRLRDVPERQLGSLRDVIGNIRRDGGTPSVDSIATKLSSIASAQRALVLLALQHTHGNRYVQRVVSGIQAKLKVGQPGDIYEQEADMVADEVMRMPEPQVQRACAFSGEYPKYRAEQLGRNYKLLQNKPIQANNDEGMTAPPIVHKVLRLPGQQLDPATKAFFEQRFGHNFSQVRVHTGTVAAESAQAINAKAFTVGKNVVFGHGQYSPQSDEGRRLLAHELVHTVQQGATGRSPSSQPATIYRYVSYDVIDSLSRTDLPGGVGDTGAAERILLGLNDEDFTDTMVAVRDMGQLEYLFEHSRPVRTRYYQLPPSERVVDPAVCEALPPSERFVDPAVCEALQSALSNSEQMISIFREFLAGDIDWEELQSHRRIIGMAGVGVVGAGLDMPQIVQNAINELERFGIEEIEQGARLFRELVFGTTESTEREHVSVEIERHTHFNDIVRRYLEESGCPTTSGRTIPNR
jgi:hypothetical protein